MVLRAIRYELSLYVSLVRWIARRKSIPAGSTPYTYHRMVTPVMWLWIFASAAEVPAVHFLIPWEGVRLALLAVSVWGLVWMVGLLASLNVYPHLLDEDGLRIRRGAQVDLRVPWAAIGEVKVDERDLPSTIKGLQPRDTERGTDLQVATSGRTNVSVSLTHPVSVPTPKGPLEITAIAFWADDPREVARIAR